jgi:RNAse (barnase) inhibitor barstar
MTSGADLDRETDDANHVTTLPFGPHTASALCSLARSLGLRCARIDLEGCAGKDDLLARIGAALEFPQWYGANWDALFDCLNDLAWLPAKGYVLVLENTGGLRETAPADFEAFCAVLNESAAAWRGRGVPFRAILGAR